MLLVPDVASTRGNSKGDLSLPHPEVGERDTAHVSLDTLYVEIVAREWDSNVTFVKKELAVVGIVGGICILE